MEPPVQKCKKHSFSDTRGGNVLLFNNTDRRMKAELSNNFACPSVQAESDMSFSHMIYCDLMIDHCCITGCLL